MRFIRVFTDAAGEPVAVVESEQPIGSAWLRDGQPLAHYDLGLMLDFDPLGIDGQPTSVADAIRQRVEKHPEADRNPDAPRCRIAPAHTDLPALHFCPASEAEIVDQLKARGPDGLPVIAQAWLTRVLPPAKLRAMGLDASVSLATLKALEANRRGLIDGGRLAEFERKAQELSDARNAADMARRAAAAPINGEG